MRRAIVVALVVACVLAALWVGAALRGEPAGPVAVVQERAPQPVATPTPPAVAAAPPATAEPPSNGPTPDVHEAFARARAEERERGREAREQAKDAPPLSFNDPGYPEHLLPAQFAETMDRVRDEMQGELGGRRVELSEPECDRVPCMVTLTIELSAEEAERGLTGTSGIGDEVGGLFHELVGWGGTPPATMRGVWGGEQQLSFLYLPYTNASDPVRYAQQEDLLLTRWSKPRKSFLQRLLEVFF